MKIIGKSADITFYVARLEGDIQKEFFTLRDKVFRSERGGASADGRTPANGEHVHSETLVNPDLTELVFARDAAGHMIGGVQVTIIRKGQKDEKGRSFLLPFQQREVFDTWAKLCPGTPLETLDRAQLNSLMVDPDVLQRTEAQDALTELLARFAICNTMGQKVDVCLSLPDMKHTNEKALSRACGPGQTVLNLPLTDLKEVGNRNLWDIERISEREREVREAIANDLKKLEAGGKDEDKVQLEFLKTQMNWPHIPLLDCGEVTLLSKGSARNDNKRRLYVIPFPKSLDKAAQDKLREKYIMMANHGVFKSAHEYNYFEQRAQLNAVSGLFFDLIGQQVGVPDVALPSDTPAPTAEATAVYRQTFTSRVPLAAEDYRKRQEVRGTKRGKDGSVAGEYDLHLPDAVLFDWDQVMMEHTRPWVMACNRLFINVRREHGIEPDEYRMRILDPEQDVRKFVQYCYEDSAYVRQMMDGERKLFLNKLAEDLHKEYYAHYLDEIDPLPEAIQTMRMLKTLKVPYAFVSNGQSEKIRNYIDRMFKYQEPPPHPPTAEGWRKYPLLAHRARMRKDGDLFNVPIIGCADKEYKELGEGHLWMKAGPKGFQKALDMLGIKPGKRVWFVGDTVHSDVLGALNMGLHPILFGTRELGELHKVQGRDRSYHNARKCYEAAQAKLGPMPEGTLEQEAWFAQRGEINDRFAHGIQALVGKHAVRMENDDLTQRMNEMTDSIGTPPEDKTGDAWKALDARRERINKEILDLCGSDFVDMTRSKIDTSEFQALKKQHEKAISALGEKPADNAAQTEWQTAQAAIHKEYAAALNDSAVGFAANHTDLQNIITQGGHLTGREWSLQHTWRA